MPRLSPQEGRLSLCLNELFSTLTLVPKTRVLSARTSVSGLLAFWFAAVAKTLSKALKYNSQSNVCYGHQGLPGRDQVQVSDHTCRTHLEAFQSFHLSLHDFRSQIFRTLHSFAAGGSLEPRASIPVSQVPGSSLRGAEDAPSAAPDKPRSGLALCSTHTPVPLLAPHLTPVEHRSLWPFDALDLRARHPLS